MAELESQEGNYDKSGKVENVKTVMEELLEKMEKLTVHTAWVVYYYVAIKTNPDLFNAMQRLEETFLLCKTLMEKKWHEDLMESRGEGQRKK